MRAKSLVVLIVLGAGVLTYGQKATIAFDTIPQVSPMRTREAIADNAKLAGRSGSLLPISGFVWSAPPLPARRRAFDRKFALLAGLQLGTAMMDVETTQRCMAAGHCREANPLMPSSHAGQIGVNLGSVAATTIGAYWAKKHHVKLWWIAPVIGIAAHSAGIATGLAHR